MATDQTPGLAVAPSPVRAAPALSVDAVTKVYRDQQGTRFTALDEVSLDVADGEFVSLLGPSGCGKTTLLKVCAGLLPPTDGTVEYQGQPGPPRPGKYGIVFQNPTLLPWWTVLENVLLPARILDLDMTEARARAHDLLKLVELHDVDKKYPGELSGGMQQRVAIARALLHDPSILFMDEPFGALDALTREELNMQLQDLHVRLGKTVCFVTHSIPEAVLLSDRVVVMSLGGGHIVSQERIGLTRPRTLVDQMSAQFRELELKVRETMDMTGRHGRIDPTGASG